LEALTAVDGLTEQLEEEGIEDPVLRSQAALLRGDALLATGNREEAEAVFLDLRENYPGSKAAALSLLIEARTFAALDLSADAQRKLVNLAESYQDSEYAPVALFEAAIIAESRGTEESLNKALQLLDTLAVRYPRHPLVFEARLREGDILREKGQFEVAKAFYENTLNSFPDHPERYRAEINRAICVLSNPSASKNLLRDAGSSLDNIADRPYLPINARVEAVVHQMAVWRRMEEPERSVQAAWTALDRFLIDPDEPEPLSPSDRRALSRLILRLGAQLDDLARPEEARRAYGLVEEYSLPGAAVARERIRAIPVTTRATAQTPNDQP